MFQGLKERFLVLKCQKLVKVKTITKLLGLVKLCI